MASPRPTFELVLKLRTSYGEEVVWPTNVHPHGDLLPSVGGPVVPYGTVGGDWNSLRPGLGRAPGELRRTAQHQGQTHGVAAVNLNPFVHSQFQLHFTTQLLAVSRMLRRKNKATPCQAKHAGQAFGLGSIASAAVL